MIVEISEYKDIDIENLEASKVSLANKIIEQVRPLVDDIFLEKVKEVKELEKRISRKKDVITENKCRIEKKIIVYNRKKKLKKLLERIEQLESFGMLYGELKKEMIIVLKVLDTIDDNKLNKYLQTTMEIVNKKISK